VPPVTAERSPPASRITGADELAGNNQHHIVLPQRRRADDFRSAIQQPLRRGFRSGLAQVVGLRLAASFGHRLGKVGEQHGEPEPESDLQFKHDAGYAGNWLDDSAYELNRGQHAADFDDEHHRVFHHRARTQLDDRIQDGAFDDAPVPDR